MPWTEGLPSGRYRALFRDADGKRHTVKGTFPHKKRALAAAVRAEEDSRKPGWRDPSAAAKPWGEWLPVWLDGRKIEPGTLSKELSLIKNHIEPYWKSTALADITRHDVDVWTTKLQRGEKPLSASSAQRCLNVFKSSLSAAVDKEVLAVNPARGIKVEVGQTDVRRYLTREEYLAILEQIPDEFHRLVVEFLVYTGLRFGEMAGLQVQRLKADYSSMRVAEVWVASLGYLKAYPKGRRIRSVGIPPWLRDRLSTLVADRKEGFVFLRRGISVIDYNNFQKLVGKAVERAGVGKATIHDFRHTNASWLLQGGISIEELSRHLGHENIQTTMIYAHLAKPEACHFFEALELGGMREPDERRGAKRGAESRSNVPQPALTGATARAENPRSAPR